MSARTSLLLAVLTVLALAAWHLQRQDLAAVAALTALVTALAALASSWPR